MFQVSNLEQPETQPSTYVIGLEIVDPGVPLPDGKGRVVDRRMEAIKRIGRRTRKDGKGGRFWIVREPDQNKECCIGDQVDDEFLESCVTCEADYDRKLDDPTKTHTYVISYGNEPVGTMRFGDPQNSIFGAFAVAYKNGQIRWESISSYFGDESYQVLDRLMFWQFPKFNENTPSRLFTPPAHTMPFRQLYTNLQRSARSWLRRLAKSSLLVAVAAAIIDEAYPINNIANRKHITQAILGPDMLSALSKILGPHIMITARIHTCAVKIDENNDGMQVGEIVPDYAFATRMSNAGIAFTLYLTLKTAGYRELAEKYRDIAADLAGIARRNEDKDHKHTNAKRHNLLGALSDLVYTARVGTHIWLDSFGKYLSNNPIEIPDPQNVKQPDKRRKILRSLMAIAQIIPMQTKRLLAIYRVGYSLKAIEILTGSKIDIHIENSVAIHNTSNI